jgi:hypothetical protein
VQRCVELVGAVRFALCWDHASGAGRSMRVGLIIMAHLWTRASTLWEPVKLDADAFDLACATAPVVSDQPRPQRVSTCIRLRRVGAGQDARWVMVAGPTDRVLMNGAPAVLGLSVLMDRDEIRLPDGRQFFFSSEMLVSIEPFPATGIRGFCPRCKQVIAPGSPAVRCPACGLWHHASDDLPCWTYGLHCAACPQDTALDAGFQWTPEEW